MQIRAGSREGTHAHCVFHACRIRSISTKKRAASCIAQELLWTDLQIEFFYQWKGVYFMENELVNIQFIDEKWSIEICKVSLISFKEREI